jgi:hypothetical protein
MEVSGIHHNSAGNDTVRLHDFRYRAAAPA